MDLSPGFFVCSILTFEDAFVRLLSNRRWTLTIQREVDMTEGCLIIMRVAGTFFVMLTLLGLLMMFPRKFKHQRKKISEITGLSFLSDHVNYYITVSVVFFVSALCTMVLMGYSRLGVDGVGVLIVSAQSILGLLSLVTAIFHRFE